jgi:choline kinase
MLDILIIAPEITKGMKSLGSKALLIIKKNLSVIQYQILQANNLDKHSRITVILGFEYEKILNTIQSYKNINYIINHEYRHTNQAYSLKLFYDKHKDVSNLLIISSGVLLKDMVIDKSMLIDRSKVFLLNKDKENFELGCSQETDYTEYIFYDLPSKWSECVYLNREGIEATKTVVSKNSSDQMYLFETINSILGYTSIDKCFIDRRKIMKINNQKDIPKAKVFI